MPENGDKTLASKPNAWGGVVRNVVRPRTKEEFEPVTWWMAEEGGKHDAVDRLLAREALNRQARKIADPAALEGGGIEGVYAIGDVVAPRLIADYVFDGHRFTREVDSPTVALSRTFASAAPPTTLPAPLTEPRPLGPLTRHPFLALEHDERAYPSRHRR